MDEVLVVDVINLLGLDDLALLEELEGNILAGLLVLSNLDLAEATCMRDVLPLPRVLPISKLSSLSFLTASVCTLFIEFKQVLKDY